MRMARAKFRPKRQRFRLERFQIDPVSLSRRAINHSSSIRSPGNIRNVSLPVENIYFAQRRSLDHHHRVVSPVAANLHHARQEFSVTTEHKAYVSGKSAFFAELRII